MCKTLKNRSKNKGKRNKIGLPPNKRYCLTPLARHNDFNDAHIKSSDWDMQKSIMNSMKNTFKSNPLPMHMDFVS